MKNVVSVDRQILRRKFSASATVVYIALMGLETKMNPVYVTPYLLYYELSRRAENMTRTTYYELLKGLNELERGGFISIKRIPHKIDEFIIDIKKIRELSCRDIRTQIYEREILNILNRVIGVKGFKVLKYYVTILAYRGGKPFATTRENATRHLICAKSRPFLSSKCDSTPTALVTYEKILEDLKILFVYKVNDAGFVPFNCYARYSKKEEALKQIKLFLSKKSKVDFVTEDE